MTSDEAYKIMEAAFHACDSEPQPDMILVHPRYWEAQMEWEDMMTHAGLTEDDVIRFIAEDDWTAARASQVARFALAMSRANREAQDELAAQARAFGRAQQATQQEAPQQPIFPNGVLARGPFPKPKMCACRVYEYGAIHTLTGPCDLGNPFSREELQGQYRMLPPMPKDAVSAVAACPCGIQSVHWQPSECRKKPFDTRKPV